jgi:hydroxymethylbilane synthase
MMLPAPGQGALGIQIRAADAETREVMLPVGDAPSYEAVAAERAFLGRLQGGCRLPAGAHAVHESGGLRLVGAVIAPDGRRIVRGDRVGAAAQAEAIGRALADELLARGAGDLAPAGRGVS